MNKVAGLILAGGEGRRMLGQDKGLVLFQGKPLVQHVIERIAPQVDVLYLSANRNIGQYQQLNYPLIEDLSEFKGMGPLAGLASIEPQLPADITHVQLSACDNPFLAGTMVQNLLDFLHVAEPNCMATMPALDEHVHQYSSLLIKRQALAQVADFLRTDTRLRIRDFLALVHAQPCYHPDFTLEHMHNFNSHEEIQNYVHGFFKSK